jgi:hypothetical protein
MSRIDDFKLAVNLEGATYDGWDLYQWSQKCTLGYHFHHWNRDPWAPTMGEVIYGDGLAPK